MEVKTINQDQLTEIIEQSTFISKTSTDGAWTTHLRNVSLGEIAIVDTGSEQSVLIRS